MKVTASVFTNFRLRYEIRKKEFMIPVALAKSYSYLVLCYCATEHAQNKSPTRMRARTWRLTAPACSG